MDPSSPATGAGVSPHSTVLLLSSDAMTLALLGLLVEVAGFKPLFAHHGERPEDAIARVLPGAAVLIDDLLDIVRSDVFFAWASQHRVPLAVFAGKGSRREHTARISARGVACIDPPLDSAQLTAAIATASSSEWWRRG